VSGGLHVKQGTPTTGNTLLFLGSRQHHSAISSLQAAMILFRLGAKPRNTTSFLCFHSSQQQRRMREITAGPGTWRSAGVDFQSSSTGAIASACHPMCLQNDLAKGQPDMMWSAVSSGAPQMSRSAFWRMCLRRRDVLHWIRLLVRSHPKNLTRGGAKLRQTKSKAGHVCSPRMDALLIKPDRSLWSSVSKLQYLSSGADVKVTSLRSCVSRASS